MNTAERRKQIMEILSVRRHETMVNLASEFDVSVRTIQRDIEELSLYEPIYTQSGRHHGGVYVTQGYSCRKEYFDEGIIALINKLICHSDSGSPYRLSSEERNVITNFLTGHTKPARRF